MQQLVQDWTVLRVSVPSRQHNHVHWVGIQPLPQSLQAIQAVSVVLQVTCRDSSKEIVL